METMIKKSKKKERRSDDDDEELSPNYINDWRNEEDITEEELS